MYFSFLARVIGCSLAALLFGLPVQNVDGQSNRKVFPTRPYQAPNRSVAWETLLGTPLEDTRNQEGQLGEEFLSADWPGSASADDAADRAERAQRLASLKNLREVETAVEALVPRVAPCIVSIGETASGVIVKPTGIVITASHVTRKAGRIMTVRLADGREVRAITLGSNAANDTSAMQLLGNGPWPYLKTVGTNYTAQAGQWCVAIGYPLNWPRDKPASARLGRVTGQYRGKIVTDCPIMGGDSGGALVDLNGNLLGINSSVRLEVTQNLHVPIARYREDWQYMMAKQDVDIQTAVATNKTPAVTNATNTPNSIPNKKSGRPYLGIYGESAWKSVRIRDVRRGSPAEKAGLVAEDVIWQIDNTPIESFAELLRYIAGRQGGDQITVGINRFGSQMKITMTLEAR